MVSKIRLLILVGGLEGSEALKDNTEDKESLNRALDKDFKQCTT